MAAFALTAGDARAQANDAKPESIAALKQENAALRKRIERLELENENAALRARLDRLERAETGAGAPSAAASRHQQASAVKNSNSPATAAWAADMPVKALRYPVSKTAAVDWTGFYVGGNLGVGLGRNPTDATGLIPPVLITSSRIAPFGFIGGGQVGYNWQVDPNWVWGVETDIQGAHQSDSLCDFVCEANGVSPSPLTLEQKLRWFGTVRGRVGYGQDGWLWYVTGGLAYGQVDNNYSFATGGTSGAVDASHIQTGWTVGAGVETQLWGHWSAKAEYLYMDLGSTTDTFVVAPATFTVHSNVRNNVARFGLNYRWGAGAPPRTAGLDRVATADWSGVYIGGNLGYSVARDPTDTTDFEPTVTALVDSEKLSPAGFLGGAQIGYNWQPYSRWVLGLEADAQWSNQRGSVCVFECGLSRFDLDQRVNWFGTVRGRFGYARGDWLWYGTGGFAFGDVENRYSFSSILTSAVGALTARHFQTGWAIGAGVETKLWDNWSAKVEYLYMDLGHANDRFVVTSGVGSATENIQSAVRNQVFRAGLNYRFGPAPID